MGCKWYWTGGKDAVKRSSLCDVRGIVQEVEEWFVCLPDGCLIYLKTNKCNYLYYTFAFTLMVDGLCHGTPSLSSKIDEQAYLRKKLTFL